MKNIIFLLLTCFASFAQTVKQDDKVFSTAEIDVQPEYPGGLSKFYEIISKETIVPNFKEDTVAKAYIVFTITEEGQILKPTVMRETAPGTGDAVLTALTKVTEKWSPALKDGKPVKVRYVLPVTFNIKASSNGKKKQ